MKNNVLQNNYMQTRKRKGLITYLFDFKTLSGLQLILWWMYSQFYLRFTFICWSIHSSTILQQYVYHLSLWLILLFFWRWASWRYDLNRVRSSLSSCVKTVLSICLMITMSWKRLFEFSYCYTNLCTPVPNNFYEIYL